MVTDKGLHIDLWTRYIADTTRVVKTVFSPVELLSYEFARSYALVLARVIERISLAGGSLVSIILAAIHNRMILRLTSSFIGIV